MMKASISLVFGIVVNVALLIATPVAAREATGLLDKYLLPYFACEAITGFASFAEQEQLTAQAARSAANWKAELAERKQREREATRFAREVA